MLSVHRASQVRCAIGDEEASLDEARRDWYICTRCGCYVCPRCYELFRRSGQQMCPGTLSLGAEEHSPHFTRFLPRAVTGTLGITDQSTQQTQPTSRSTVVILGDVPRRREPTRGGRVVILGDVEREEEPEQAGDEDAR